MKHLTVFGLAILLFSLPAHSQQAWRDCTPGSIGPGGCDSIGPGGGRSIGPGGGMSIGPGGGLSIGPGGGQSIGPGGGQSIGPGGGKSIMRDRSRGLNTDTMRPYNNPYGMQPPPIKFNKAVNRTPKAYRFWFPALALRRRLPQRYILGSHGRK